MTQSILIGVGGTGARLVESALYLMAAGLGPAGKVHVALVDQDNSNGNVGRTLTTLRLIEELRADFSGQRSPNRLDWTLPEDRGGTAFLNVDVRPMAFDGGDGSGHWVPDPDARSLRARLDVPTEDSAERDLFDLLFRKGSPQRSDAEQEMPLDRGYAARAHVGAAALLDAFHAADCGFRRALFELIMKSNQEEVRVVLLGSLFGGTGAAAFPTLARTIDQVRTRSAAAGAGGTGDGTPPQANPRNLRLGGVLMLPYFGFAEPGDPNVNAVRTEQLLPQSRVALGFYGALLDERRTFDRLYLAGWNRMFSLGYFAPGRAAQKNPPMQPELLGALAALEFLTADAIPAEEGPLVPLASARSSDRELPWTEVPADALGRERVHDAVGRLLRFAYFWRFGVEPEFDTPPARTIWQIVKGQKPAPVTGNIAIPWLRALAKGTDWQSGTPETRVRLSRFVEGVLAWAASMQLFGCNAPGWRFALWDMREGWREARPQEPADPITLHDRLDDGALARGFETLTSGLDGTAPTRTAAQMFADLNQPEDALPKAGSAALGRVVWAVFRGARPHDGGGA